MASSDSSPQATCANLEISGGNVELKPDGDDDPNTTADNLSAGIHTFSIKVTSSGGRVAQRTAIIRFRLREKGTAACTRDNLPPSGTLSCDALVQTDNDGVPLASQPSCSITDFSDDSVTDAIYEIIANNCPGGEVSINPSTGELTVTDANLSGQNSCSIRVSFSDGCRLQTGRSSLIRLTNPSSGSAAGDEDETSVAEFIEKSVDYTAEAGDLILADTSGDTWTLTLPANPSQGDEVNLFDSTGSWGSNNLTVERNGSKIDATEENLLLDVSGTTVQLIFLDAEQGWRVYW